MNLRPLSLALWACACTQAIAGQTPTAGNKDSRMRTVVYDPKQVVRLSTAIGGALIVGFSADERVTAVAVSDSKDLVANPRENFLFMKSKAALPPQPVIVLTSGPNGVRRYVFEVESGATSSGNGQSDIYYSVEFLYPGDRAAVRSVARARRAATLELARAHSEMDNAAQNALGGKKNWHYVGQGSRALLPIEVFDNGYSTAFRFPGNIRIPAIFRINPDGREAAANYSVKGTYVVVGAVAPGWRLRDGNSVLRVWNRAYDKIGGSPGTNTTSPRVKRILKDAPK